MASDKTVFFYDLYCMNMMLHSWSAAFLNVALTGQRLAISEQIES